jgi:hypothetical protein
MVLSITTTAVPAAAADGGPDEADIELSPRETVSGGVGSPEGEYGADSRQNTLTITGEGTATNYQVAVSGNLQANPDEGELESDNDRLTGSIAQGWVTTSEHVDSFHYTGELLGVDFLEGDATVLKNGEEIDPETLGSDLSNIVTITGEGESARYDFTVSGDLAPHPAEGPLELDNDDLDSPNASGWVTSSEHVDSFRFSGEITEFSFTRGEATVTVNGEERDPADIGDGSEAGGSRDDIQGQNSSSPTPVASDGEFEGWLTAENRTHQYTFEANEGQAIRFVGYIFSEGADGRIVLEGPSGDELLNMSNRGEATDSVPYGAYAEETGTYTVTLHRTDRGSDSGGLPYSFDLSTAPADIRGDNGDRESATALKPGETFEGNRSEGEEDWFSVSADAGDRITATLTAEAESWYALNDIGLEVYGPDGSRIGGRSPDDSPPNRTDIFSARYEAVQEATAETDGTYYVRVTDVSVEGYTAYDLSVDVEGGSGEEGDTPEGLDDSEPGVVTVRGEGEATNYQLAVSGNLQASPDDGALESDTDRLKGSIAKGWVTTAEHVDSFHYTGEILGLDFLRGEATVLVNGREVDPAALEAETPNVITIRGTGEGANYDFAVSGDLRPNPDRGALELDNDNLDSPRASGWVTSPEHVDSFRFSGEVTEFTFTESTATVTVNGERVDPDGLGDD